MSIRKQVEPIDEPWIRRSESRSTAWSSMFVPIGIMPITGIPLPFVSYGGSWLLRNSAAVGLLLNVHMRRFN